MFSPARTPPVDGVSEKDIMNSARGHTVRANIYYPTDNNGGLPVYLYFHAGGYMVGSPEILETAARHLVKKHNMVVITPSYRLAPDNPFPAAVDDVWAWTQLVAHHATELGVGADPSKMYILAGESVRGNMAFVAALKARYHPDLMNGVQVSGLHVMCAQLCSNKAIPKKYQKWYKSYEQNKDAPRVEKSRMVFKVSYSFHKLNPSSILH